ncbi:MAG: DNA/RNA non-specific endonuclease, partial [Bacteroidales bacterium]|nr:DNA/RNA non-specific endonuclease [Bacteroidales bacterium]
MQELKKKLEKEGALSKAASWLDEQIALLNLSPSAIMADFKRFWKGLSITDVRRPRHVLESLLKVFSAPINRIIRFAKNVAVKFLEIVKDFVLSKVVDFVKKKTSAYPLLTVILGKDPITGKVVKRSGMNILKGFILLAPDGKQQLSQMQSTGTLQKAAKWIDVSILKLTTAFAGLREAFSGAWDLLTIQNLLNPISTFKKLYNLFAKPVGMILSFLVEVGIMILKFIKDALIKKLIDFAKTIPGYDLLTVILGRDPFSGKRVKRTVVNIVKGFLSLIPGGKEKFEEIMKTGALQKAAAGISKAVDALGFTWTYITGLFTKLWNSFSLKDLAKPLQAFKRIMNTISNPLKRLIRFVIEIIKIIVKTVLVIMKFPFKTVESIMTNAMQAFHDIKKDPIGFLMNLLKALKKGFAQFFKNILKHLLKGVSTWLFSEISKAGINPPADLSFKSVLGFVLDVLGISVDNILDRLGKKIGQDKVTKIKGVIDKLTGIWSFVRDVIEKGPVAIWEKIQEQLNNLWNMVLGFISNWIMEKVITKVTAKLLSMLDPTGIMAVINGAIALYRAIESFMEKLREMLEIVNAFVAGVANIAKGDITQAANYLENALARGIPVAIGFLANQVGLRGLGKRISEMIGKLREKVNKAIDKIIDKAWNSAKALINKILDRDNKDQPASGNDPQSREQNKQAAIREIRKRIAQGIRRSQLRTLLQQLRKKFRLKRAELNSSDDVIIENSAPVTIKARPITVNRTDVQQPAQNAQTKTTPTGNKVTIGSFTGTKDSGVKTIFGVLRDAGVNAQVWPYRGDVTTADRPRTVVAELYGYPGDKLSPETRNSDNTRLVGHFGNYESGLRRGNVSWRKRYDGGHILGHQFGGNENFDNLVPQQNNELNRGLYTRLENFMQKSLPAKNASQLANPGQTRLNLSATMNYTDGDITRSLLDTAKVATSGMSSNYDFYKSVDPSKHNNNITIPYRTPNSMEVKVKLSADLIPASLTTEK